MLIPNGRFVHAATIHIILAIRSVAEPCHDPILQTISRLYTLESFCLPCLPGASTPIRGQIPKWRVTTRTFQGTRGQALFIDRPRGDRRTVSLCALLANTPRIRMMLSSQDTWQRRWQVTLKSKWVLLSCAGLRNSFELVSILGYSSLLAANGLQPVDGLYST